MATSNCKLLHSLFRLPGGVKVIDVIRHPHLFEYSVTFPLNRACPVCGGNNTVIKGHSENSRIHHLPINEYGTFIRFDQTRLLCKDCKITFWYRPDWIHPHLDITMPLYHKIVLELCAHQATPKIASNCGVSQDMIFSVLNDLIIDHPSQLPEALGIDEFSGDVYTGSEKKTKLLVNISDLSCLPERDPDERGRSSWIIDVLPDTSLAYLKAFFMENYTVEQRKAVRYFCCDMHGGFIQLARTVFPDAAICFDMFHIVKRLNKAINDTRLRVQRSFFDYKEGRRVFKDGMKQEYEFLQRASRILLINEIDRPIISQFIKDRLAHCYELSSDICIVRDAVQEFHELKTGHIISGTDLRPRLLEEWIVRHKDSDVPELKDVVLSIRKWQPYICNTWKHICSNASCEGLNREIKDVKRIACGFNRFDSFRKRILLTCGPYKLEYQSFSIRSEKNSIVETYHLSSTQEKR